MSTPEFRSGVRGFAIVLTGGVLVLSSAEGAQTTFNINANGAKEVTVGGVPNQGDLDGSATGTLVLNNGTGSGSTGSATFSLTLSNVDITTLSGHHIHIGPATTTGTIVLDFGDPDTIRIGSLISGTITGLSATQITTILGNPTNFYYNLHNGAFPSGAVRDQLPEPTSMILILGGAVGLFAFRRHRRTVPN